MQLPVFVTTLSLVAALGARPMMVPIAHAVDRRAPAQAPGQSSPSSKDAKPPADAAAVVGRWHLSAAAPGFTNQSELEFKLDDKDKSGKKLLGTFTGTQMGDIPFKGECSKG